MIELEKTYLAKFLPPELKTEVPEPMVDIYVPESAAVHHPTLRLRSRGGQLEITKKAPVENDASKQLEQTIPLNEAEFKNLSSASQRRIVKDRYKIKLGGRTAEIDVFKEKLSGLVLIDFEFKSEAEKDAFQPPDCCLADITQETFIAGGMLAGKSYKDIETQLAKFGYKKLG